MNYGSVKSNYLFDSISDNGLNVISDVFEFVDESIATGVFEFLADNTIVEWSEIETGESESNHMSYVATSHMKTQEPTIGSIFRYKIFEQRTLKEINHSHPSGRLFPSGIKEGEIGDVQFADWIYRCTGYDVNFNIYIPNRKKYIPFTRQSTELDFMGSYTF